MYNPVVQLYESGDPEVIDDPRFHTDVTVSKSCRKTDDTSKNYWEISQKKISIDKTGISAGNQGLIFVTYSEKITPSYLGNYSIIGFYTIIVYAVGTILRRVSFWPILMYFMHRVSKVKATKHSFEKCQIQTVCCYFAKAS